MIYIISQIKCKSDHSVLKIYRSFIARATERPTPPVVFGGCAPGGLFESLTLLWMMFYTIVCGTCLTIVIISCNFKGQFRGFQIDPMSLENIPVVQTGTSKRILVSVVCSIIREFEFRASRHLKLVSIIAARHRVMTSVLILSILDAIEPVLVTIWGIIVHHKTAKNRCSLSTQYIIQDFAKCISGPDLAFNPQTHE
jgi:hypothetical protein